MRRDRFWLAGAALAAGALAQRAEAQVRPPAAADSSAPYDCRINLVLTFRRSPWECQFLPGVDDGSAVWVVRRAAELGTDRARTAAVLVAHGNAVYKAAARSGRLADAESAVRFTELAHEYARAVHANIPTAQAEFLVFVAALHAATAADSAARMRRDCAVALRAVRYVVRVRETMPPSRPGHPAPDWRPLYRRASSQVDRLCAVDGAARAPG